MKKLWILAGVILFAASFAYARPPAGPMPPPGGEYDDYMGPPPPRARQVKRVEVWKKFKKENPKDAATIMRICKEHPELRCGFIADENGRRDRRPGMRPGGRPGMRPGMGPGMGPEGRPGEGPGMGPPHERWNPQLAEKHKKMQELRAEAKELGRKYRETESAGEKKKIEKELRKVLNDLYVVRLELMKGRVKDVESRVKTVKTELEKYAKDRDGVIDAWFKKVTGNDEDRYKRF